jgi:translocation protein SEC62
MYYRIGLLVAIVGFVYWACTQPTEFDGFLKANKDFIDDLYSGNLLADVAHNTRENIDRNNKRVPNLEDLLKEMEMDLLEEKNSKANASSVEEEDVFVGADGLSEKMKMEEGESTAMDENLLEEMLKEHAAEDEREAEKGDDEESSD